MAALTLACSSGGVSKSGSPCDAQAHEEKVVTARMTAASALAEDGGHASLRRGVWH